MGAATQMTMAAKRGSETVEIALSAPWAFFWQVHGPQESRPHATDRDVEEDVMKPQSFLGLQRARTALCVALAFGFLPVVRLVSTPQRLVPISRLVERDWAIPDVNCRITGKPEVIPEAESPDS